MVKLLILAFSLAIPLQSQTILLGRRQGARSGSTPPQIVRDTFERTDANPMSTTASDGTSIWTNAPGALESCQVLNNNLRASAGVVSGCMIIVPSFNPNQSATITLEGAGTDLTQVGVMVRMQSATDCSGYLASVDDETHISIYRVDDTGTIAYVLLGTQFTVSTLAEGHTVTLGITGSTLTLYINGISQGSRGPDTTYEFGQPGAYFVNTTGYINTFTAGNL